MIAITRLWEASAAFFLNSCLMSAGNAVARHAQEHVFRGIQKGEWLNLFNFIRQKRLRIENLREAEAGPSGPGLPVDFGADIDTGEHHELHSCDSASLGEAACLW